MKRIKKTAYGGFSQSALKKKSLTAREDLLIRNLVLDCFTVNKY